METPTQGASGYYVWEIAETPFQVHVHLDAIEGMAAAIMRGFSAVPKRGAEVGGLLLGSIERGDVTTVFVEDFEPEPCRYTRGPSYLLSADEREAFEGAAQAWRPDAARPSYAVGYYRSHTREGLALAPEDTELMDRCFPDPAHIVLLVKPFATKASIAGFFFRENGVFQEITPLEFPFRRRELTGEEVPERRPLNDRRSWDRGERALLRSPSEDWGERSAIVRSSDAVGRAYPIGPPMPAPSVAWMWIPLSFIFLLLGVVLGYLAALTVSPRNAVNTVPEDALSLAAVKGGENLSLRWNSQAPAIRNAERGVLEVHDGGYAKTVELDAAQLRGGKLAFHNVSDAVSFHLTVYLNSRQSVSETLDWHP